MLPGGPIFGVNKILGVCRSNLKMGFIWFGALAEVYTHQYT